MADFDPALLGPITRPIWRSLLDALATIDEGARDYLHGPDLVAKIHHDLDANPSTINSMLDAARQFGLIYGIKRIRPTHLGRLWLTDHHHPEQHAT